MQKDNIGMYNIVDRVNEVCSRLSFLCSKGENRTKEESREMCDLGVEIKLLEPKLTKFLIRARKAKSGMYLVKGS